MGKFLRFQDMITMDMPCNLPSELNCFQTYSIKMKEIVKGRVFCSSYPCGQFTTHIILTLFHMVTY